MPVAWCICCIECAADDSFFLRLQLACKQTTCTSVHTQTITSLPMMSINKNTMKEAQAAQAQAPKKTVAISDVDSIHTLVVDELPETTATWYTKRETRSMQVNACREALRLSRVLLSTAPESITDDQQQQLQLKCLGIENAIPDMARQASQGRRNHLRLILRAQHVYTEKDLSTLSKTSSASACQRAYMLGTRDFE